MVDAHVTALFDGEKTTIHHTSGNSGRVSAGNRFGEESTGKYLRNIFTAFGIDIRTDLHKANSLVYVKKEGLDLLRANFSFEPEGTIDIYLNPNNAFHIQFAEARDMQGELKGLRRSTGFLHIPGTPKVSVFILGMYEDIYGTDGNVIKSEKLSGTIKEESINKPCSHANFVYNFPGGTLVNDEIKGTNKVTPFVYEMPDGSGFVSRLPVDVLTNSQDVPSITIPVSFNISAEIICEPAVVAFGHVSSTSQNKIYCEVHSQRDFSIQILDVTPTTDDVKITLVARNNNTSKIGVFCVQISDNAPREQAVTANVRIRTTSRLTPEIIVPVSFFIGAEYPLTKTEK